MSDLIFKLSIVLIKLKKIIIKKISNSGNWYTRASNTKVQLYKHLKLKISFPWDCGKVLALANTVIRTPGLPEVDEVRTQEAKGKWYACSWSILDGKMH